MVIWLWPSDKSLCLYTRLSSLPETPAAIDWNYYRSAVAKAGMVEEFEKKVSFSLRGYLMGQKHEMKLILRSLI